MLKLLGHSGFKLFLLEVGLDNTSAGSGNSLQERANSLAKFVLDNPDQMAATGGKLGYAVVRRAAQHLLQSENPVGDTQTEFRRFLNALADDGVDLRKASVSAQPRLGTRARATVSFENHATNQVSAVSQTTSPQKVFVVHGHDEAALHSVARFIEHL